MKPRAWAALVCQLLLFAGLNFFDDWTLERMPVLFVVCAMLSGLAYLLAATEFATSARGTLWIFWSAAIALRLLAFPLAPAAEVWRYRADGAIQRAGFNPYRLHPGDPQLAAAVPEPERISRNDEPTAFSPGAELLFRAIPAGRNSTLPYKIIFTLAELAAVVLLVRLVGTRGAVWYAWNPLVAYSFAGAAHFDAVVVLALTMVLFALERFNEDARLRWVSAVGIAVALGGAISLRTAAVVLVLPCAFALGRYSPALLASIALPLGACRFFAISPWQNFFGDFNQTTRLNDLFWWLIEDTVLPNWHQQYYRYDVVILVVAAAIALLFWRNWRRALLWAAGALIVLAPVLHPWYVTWVLPIATWRRAYAWHYLSVTIFAYYLFFNERLFALPWHAEPWMRGMILVPVIFALLMLSLQKSPRTTAL